MLLKAAILAMVVALGPYCNAQGEDAYPMVDVAESSYSLPFMDATLPPPQKENQAKHGWLGRMVPSDRSIWLLSNIADLTQFSYQEVDTLETAHIKSGKGMREARLAVKMLVGAGALGSLTVEVKKHRIKRGSNRVK